MDVVKNIFLGELFYPILAIAALAVAVGGSTAWAACSWRHWFTRTAVVGAALSPSLLVPGYDLVLILFTQVVVTILYLTHIKFWRLWRASRSKKPDDDESHAEPTAWPPRFRFTLADLLLATLVLAVVTAVGSQVPNHVWAEWMWIGTLGCLAALPAAGFPDWLIMSTDRKRLGRMLVFQAKRKMRIRGTAAVIVSILMLLGLCAALLISCPAIAILHVAIHPSGPVPEIVLPNPNGYDDLARAGAQLANVPDVEKATSAELTKFLATYAPALVLARRGLDRECQVPLTYTPADLTRTTDQDIRQVARAFVAEGKLAELEGRPSDAVTSYLDTLRLAEAVSCEGNLIDALIGWAIASIAANSLATMNDPLDRPRSKRVIEALETFDEHQEPLEDLIDRVMLNSEYAFGKETRVLRVMAPDLFSEEATSEMASPSANRSRTLLRLLTCELALRQYRLEHDALPERLDELTPEYLSTVPQDPHGDGPLIYRRTESAYELYSVGPNGVDDGGEPLERMSATPLWPGDVHLLEPALYGTPEEEP